MDRNETIFSVSIVIGCVIVASLFVFFVSVGDSKLKEVQRDCIKSGGTLVYNNCIQIKVNVMPVPQHEEIQ